MSHRGTRPPRQLPLWAAFGPDVTVAQLKPVLIILSFAAS